MQLAAARADAQLMFDQTSRAFEELVVAVSTPRLARRRARGSPLGRSSDGCASSRALLRAAADARLFVLALARPEVDATFPALFDGPGKTTLALGELGRRASEELVKLSLGADVDADLVAKIVERAGGNAFFLEELVRAASERRGDELPTNVLAMLQTRLDALDERPRRLLRAASVFGRTFWRGGVVALLGGARAGADVDAVLDDLVRRELVSQRATTHFAGERALVFRHALVRDAAYATLTDEDRALGHRLAATWLEEAAEPDARTIADHLAKAGEAPRAATWCARAAERAFAANDFAAAIALARRATALDAGVELRIAMLVLEADAYLWGGSATEAPRRARRARARAVDHAEWCRAARLALRHASSVGDRELVVSLAKRVLGVTGAPPAPYLALAQSAVRSFFLYDEAPLALELAERAGALAASLPADPHARRHLLSLRCQVAEHLMQLEHHLAATRELLELVGDLGDRRGHGLIMWQLAYALMRLGQFDEAERAARAAATAGEQMRLPYGARRRALEPGHVPRLPRARRRGDRRRASRGRDLRRRLRLTPRARRGVLPRARAADGRARGRGA